MWQSYWQEFSNTFSMHIGQWHPLFLPQVVYFWLRTCTVPLTIYNGRHSCYFLFVLLVNFRTCYFAELHSWIESDHLYICTLVSCDDVICVCICTSVYEHISETTSLNFTSFLSMLPGFVLCWWCLIHYVFPDFQIWE